MQLYALVRRQDGGCDYTIGCGIDVKFILVDENVTTYEIVERLRRESVEAEEDLWGLLSDDDWKIAEAVLYRISEATPLPISDWSLAKLKAKHLAKASKEEDKERAELERLKLKYGG